MTSLAGQQSSLQRRMRVMTDRNGKGTEHVADLGVQALEQVAHRGERRWQCTGQRVQAVRKAGLDQYIMPK